MQLALPTTAVRLAAAHLEFSDGPSKYRPDPVDLREQRLPLIP
jgi:hypothetical protein